MKLTELCHMVSDNDAEHGETINVDLNAGIARYGTAIRLPVTLLSSCEQPDLTKFRLSMS
jgi:hypothetical protein